MELEGAALGAIIGFVIGYAIAYSSELVAKEAAKKLSEKVAAEEVFASGSKIWGEGAISGKGVVAGNTLGNYVTEGFILELSLSSIAIGIGMLFN